MKIVVLMAIALGGIAVAASLQALAGLAHQLPLEPRAARSRSVLRGMSRTSPATRGRPRRSPNGSSGGTAELHQLEVLAERALAGEASAVDRLARRVELAADACGLPADTVPDGAHRTAADLLPALGRLERALGRR